jgi:hypothetical protein
LRWGRRRLSAQHPSAEQDERNEMAIEHATPDG